MVKLKRVKLDILKPHHPNAVEFAIGLGAENPGYSIDVKVVEIDEKTETLEVLIEGDDIQFERLNEKIASLGGSLHSIDEVLVSSASRSRG
jgi:hypothetical protein